MRVRTMSVVMVSVAILIFMPGIASAVPPTLTIFTQTYPATAASKLNDCILCHTQPPVLNPYGTALLAAGYNFAAVEPQDSDADGFTNIQEITALTFPGDPADRPPAATGAPSAAPTVAGTTHVEDFSDATNFGDPDWEVVSGTWSAAGISRGFESAARGKSLAVLKGNPPIRNIEAGTIQATGKLMNSASRFTVIFDFMDAKHFRFVSLERKRIIVGQVGEISQTKPGVKFSQKVRIPLDEFHEIKIGLLGKGRVGVSAATSDGKDIVKPFGISFSASSPGKVGLQAESKVHVESFKVWKKLTAEK